ncbi:MAG: C25 family peptidase propeptide domain-containing protein [Euryarchaeota archaeon]|nr:C25 family peptidase propeptide domain-containing protein [Euryarchaeota archaeon]
MDKTIKTILILSAVVIAAVLYGCVEELSDHGIETVCPTPQLNVTPSATPIPKITPSPTPIPTIEATSALPLRKKIHQDIDTTPALAGLLEPYISDITVEGIGFEVTKTGDVFPLTDTGKPMVPYIIKEFKIPKDSDVESVSVNLSNPVEIRNIFIKPVQPPTIDSDEGGYYWQNYTPPPYTIDNETYASSEPYPGKEYAYKESVGIDLDTHLQVKHIVVHIYPIQYIPVENRIIAYRNASISIFYRVPAQERHL